MAGGRALSLGSVAVLTGLSLGAAAWSAKTSAGIVAEQRFAVGTAAPPTGTLSDHLEFPSHIVSGPLMHATLVVNNPGGNVNLMMTRNPTLLVMLVKRLPNGQQPEPMECFGGQYILHHGVTRISAIVVTTEPGCVESSDVPTTGPPCVDGTIPQLPPGDYVAVATWNWPVAYLPAAKPVSVVVTDK